jgi:hypothetical protein
MRPLNVFQFIYTFQPLYSPGGDPASNRNEYEKVFLVSRARPALRADNLTAICGSIV